MTTEMDVLDSAPAEVTLSSGRKVRVERLRTRQTMRLMKILTRGAGDALGTIDFSAGAEEAGPALLAAVIFSIPEAEDETIDFVRSMISPADLITDPRSKPEREVNESLQASLDDEFDNPDLDDLVTVLEKVIAVEAPHLVALGKRLAALLKVARQTTAPEEKATKKRSGSSRSGSRASTPTAS